ncbi:MAG: HD domain-containing phosphohydrolase [Acidobacteriota bacterium]
MDSAGRVLIIDDEAACRLLLREWLESCGYRCHQASDGIEGLNRALDEEWDLILSDIVMPGLTGIELAKVVKKFKSTVPVIMISGERKSTTVQTAFREGAYDFIFKPFDMDELEMTIVRAMERSRLARENEQYKFSLEQRVAEQAEKIRTLTLGSILALARALEAKDPYTNGHSQRVAEYGVLIAQQIGLDYQTHERVRVAGQLHDIGKIGLRESILNKPDRLTDEEYEVVYQHTVIGSEILKAVITDTCIICGVRHHHERFDGNGYPDRLAGGKIVLEARILAVADTYDAMTTNRAYRPGKSYDKALAELERCTGTQFDPMVVNAFARIPYDKIDKILQAIPSVQQWSFRAISR